MLFTEEAYGVLQALIFPLIANIVGNISFVKIYSVESIPSPLAYDNFPSLNIRLRFDLFCI